VKGEIMRKILMVLVVLLITGPVFGGEKTTTSIGAAYMKSDLALAKNMTVTCGKGWIEVSFLTGEAKFIDCEPSEASKALWLGLKPYFERWKEDICGGVK